MVCRMSKPYSQNKIFSFKGYVILTNHICVYLARNAVHNVSIRSELRELLGGVS